MSHAIDRMRREYIRALVWRHIARRDRDYGMVDMVEAEPEKYLPDVPLHKRGFGVMGDDMP